MCTNHLCSLYMDKQNLALNKLQGLVCHKTQLTNQPFKINAPTTTIICV